MKYYAGGWFNVNTLLSNVTVHVFVFYFFYFFDQKLDRVSCNFTLGFMLKEPCHITKCKTNRYCNRNHNLVNERHKLNFY